jgi:TRAP-type C4-dicarboxylate transport system permease small subunit
MIARLLDPIERLLAAAALALHWLGVGLVIPALVLTITVEVVLRSLFNTGILGSTEVAQLLLLMAFCASIPLCTLRHGHVYMELAHQRLRGPHRRFADLLAGLCGAGFFAAFAVQAVALVGEMRRFDDRGDLTDLPYWPFAVVIALSAVLTAAAFALWSVRALAGLPLARADTTDADPAHD